MPAVNPPNWLVLPQVKEVKQNGVSRGVEQVSKAPRGLEGEGFPVFRAFAGVGMEKLSPFVHMDQMGEVEYAPGEPKGTPWHPHRGFETVTYMIDGIFEHQDSNGGGGVISNGDTQWMTAGAGILHIEKPPEALVASGGLFHGIQLWVNLPAAQKWVAPRYQDIRGGAVSLLRSQDGAGLVRVIAGEVGGAQGPGITHTPIALAHLSLRPGARLRLPWNPSFNSLVYVLAGQGVVGAQEVRVGSGQLVVLGPGDFVELGANEDQESRAPDLEVLILGGQPIPEPVVAYGPFVMNTEAEIRTAISDYQAGRLGTIPALGV